MPGRGPIFYAWAWTYFLCLGVDLFSMPGRGPIFYAWAWTYFLCLGVDLFSMPGRGPIIYGVCQENVYNLKEHVL